MTWARSGFTTMPSEVFFSSLLTLLSRLCRSLRSGHENRLGRKLPVVLSGTHIVLGLALRMDLARLVSSGVPLGASVRYFCRVICGGALNGVSNLDKYC